MDFSIPRRSTRTEEMYARIVNNAGYFLLFFMVAFFMVIVFYLNYGYGRDWNNAYITANDLKNYDRYDFVGIPTSLLLLPHAWLFSVELSGAINQTLIIIISLLTIVKLKGGRLAICLVFTFPPFWHMLNANNIDWIPLLGFLTPMSIGAVFIALKPQLFGMMIFCFVQEKGVKVLVPLSIVGIASLLIWGLTPLHVMQSYDLNGVGWNLAQPIFPYLIPLGVILFIRGYRVKNRVLVALSSILFVPYFASYSFGIWFVVLACHYRRTAIGIYLGVWGYFIFRMVLIFG